MPVAAGAEGRDDMSVEALRTDSELSCCRRLSSEQPSADFSNKKKPGFRGRKICCVFVWARLLQSRDNDSLFAGRMVGGMNWEHETKMQKFDGRPCCQYLSCLCLFMNAVVSRSVKQRWSSVYMDTSYFSFTSTTCQSVLLLFFPLSFLIEIALKILQHLWRPFDSILLRLFCYVTVWMDPDAAKVINK